MAKKKLINRIIKILIVSDFFLFFGLGLLTPFFAVFILENIDNRIEVIGYAATCYWLTRVILVVPFSRLMDKIKGEIDEYFFMLLGVFIMAIVPIFYIFSFMAWHIYLLQIINGFANAMAVPAWRIVFTKNVDKKIVGFEWSLEDVGVGLATALSAVVGALIVNKFGFKALFIIIFMFGMMSVIILSTLNKIKKQMFKDLIKDETSKAPLKIDSFK